MTNKEALQAIIRNEKLDQPTTKRLLAAGLIEVTNVTNMDSREEELLPTFITPSGRELLDS
jgi:hypothetical protein